MQKVILIKYGELYLKGLNRPFFQRKLCDEIMSAVKPLGCTIEKLQGRLFIKGYDDENLVLSKLTKIFGIHSVSPAVELEKNMDRIKENSVQMLKEYGYIKGSFKVESKRADKKFALCSMDISRDVGEYILNALPGLTVDVHNPDYTMNIEIRENAYIYVKSVNGAGGMPLGSNGHATLLVSGGIDSPVAGWMIAKRGVLLNAVHFYSFPYTSERAKQKVVDLCKILTDYCGNIRLRVVPFTEIQQAIYKECPDSQTTLLMRRFMMRIADRIAVNNNSKALITGESIGQVASQTLDSFISTNDAVTLPVFRPLIGFDKDEIILKAKQIGTFDTSILPYEDCCTVFVPKHPVIHPRLQFIRESEKKLDVDALIDKAMQNIEVIDIKRDR